MINSIKNIFKVNMTSLGNESIYSFKKNKFLSKFISDDFYENSAMVLIFAFLGSIAKIIKLILINFVLTIVLLYIPNILEQESGISIYAGFLFMIPLLVLLTIKTFKADESKYNNVIMMKLNTKLFTIIETLKHLILNVFIIIIPLYISVLSSFLTKVTEKTPKAVFFPIVNESFIYIMLYFVLSFIFLTIILLFIYDKLNLIVMNNNFIKLPLLLFLLALPFVFAVTKISVSFNAFKIVMLVELLLTILLIIFWLIKTDAISRLYKREFSLYTSVIDEEILTLGTFTPNKMKVKVNEKINKEHGYKYFNDLFMDRHKDILFDTAKVTSLFYIFITGLLLVSLHLNPNLSGKIGNSIDNYFMIFVFILFLTNPTVSLTKAMYFHCDRAMLKYNFYRYPKTIMNLFYLRLKSILKINVIPAIVLSLCLLVLELATKVFSPVVFIEMTVSFIICSVLFCVHFLSLYYLLEPYTDNSNNASISYVALYILVLYIFANLTRFDQISLHLVLLISAIVLPIYMIIMLKLVKKLSPKTFRYK